MERYLWANPERYAELTKAGYTVERLVDDFEALHSPHIGAYLYQRRGKELMWYESEVMLRTVSKLVGLGIPVLPTHDSYLVPLNMVETTKRAIVTSIHSLYGIEIKDVDRLLKSNSLSLSQSLLGSLRESDKEAQLAPSPPSSAFGCCHPLSLLLPVEGAGGISLSH
jgi:hypothetical protein